MICKSTANQQPSRKRNRFEYLRFSLHAENFLGTGLPSAHGAEVHAHIQVEARVTIQVGGREHVDEWWIWKWVPIESEAETRRARPSSALGGKAEEHKAEVIPNTG